jgi:hypothetical protein
MDHVTQSIYSKPRAISSIDNCTLKFFIRFSQVQFDPLCFLVIIPKFQALVRRRHSREEGGAPCSFFESCIGLDLAWRCSTYSRSRICFCPRTRRVKGTDHDPDCRQMFMLYSTLEYKSLGQKKRGFAAIDKSHVPDAPSTPLPSRASLFSPLPNKLLPRNSHLTRDSHRVPRQKPIVTR